MTKRERVERASAFGVPDRPPFVPAVYEHKAALIGRRPSEVCRDADLLFEALLKELEVYDPDAPVVGLDVYNVEAEALGCPVRYFDASDDVPAVAAPIIETERDLAGLGCPDPEKDGRMPLFLEAARRLHRLKGRDMIVRGAVTGPFSLACALAGTEALLVATAEAPGFVRRLVGFCAGVSVAYGRSIPKPRRGRPHPASSANSSCRPTGTSSFRPWPRPGPGASR
jgi:uroporphyrinogen decarboxylase